MSAVNVRAAPVDVTGMGGKGWGGGSVHSVAIKTVLARNGLPKNTISTPSIK